MGGCPFGILGSRNDRSSYSIVALGSTADRGNLSGRFKERDGD